MREVYIKKESLNDWIVKHLPRNKDLFTIADLISAIEDLDFEVEHLEERIKELEGEE